MRHIKTISILYILTFILAAQKTVGQTDTLIISDSITFNELTLLKSTIHDAVLKFGKFETVDTVLSSSMSVYFIGGGCQTTMYYTRRFNFFNNTLKIETPEKSDTITKIILAIPLPVKTSDNIILGKTKFNEIMVRTDDRAFENNLNGRYYNYIKYKHVYFGTGAKFKKVRNRIRKKTVEQIVMTVK